MSQSAAQPIHILRKDAIHLWPEILVSLVILAGYSWLNALSLKPDLDNAQLIAIGAGLLRFLIPVSWLVLISRLVHDEELVGDRQFWITRPYTWYYLLGSKVLFLIVFICVPFVVMQAFVLHQAGLYPTTVLWPLVKNLSSVVGAIVLPLLAIAAVTSTFPRFASSVLGAIIYLFVAIGVASYFMPDSMGTPYLDWPITIIAVLLPLAALILQYARRKTLIARLILLSMPLVLILIAVLAPTNALVAHRYPDTAVAHVEFNPDMAEQQPDGRLISVMHKQFLEIPVNLTFNDLSGKGFLDVEQARVTLDGPNGFHYDTGWEPAMARFVPGQPFGILPLRIPAPVFDKIKDQPVALHAELGAQTFESATPYIIKATEAPFPVPGHGMCTISDNDGSLSCRYPFSNAYLTALQATVHDGTCSAPGERSAPAFGQLHPESAMIDPVVTQTTALDVGRTAVTPCANTQIAFTQAMPKGYARMHLEIPSITLNPYAMRRTERQRR